MLRLCTSKSTNNTTYKRKTLLMINDMSVIFICNNNNNNSKTTTIIKYTPMKIPPINQNIMPLHLHLAHVTHQPKSKK